MRVLVCGSRDWTDPTPIHAILAGYATRPEPTVVIDGHAGGADAIAYAAAVDLGLGTERYPADWAAHGRAAGPTRNTRMLVEGLPDVVWAFKDGFDHSLARGGTEDMVKQAKKAGLPTYVVSRG